MSKNETTVDRWIRKTKTHPVLSLLFFLCLIVVYLGTLTDALDKIGSFGLKYFGVLRAAIAQPVDSWDITGKELYLVIQSSPVKASRVYVRIYIDGRTADSPPLFEGDFGIDRPGTETVKIPQSLLPPGQYALRLKMILPKGSTVFKLAIRVHEGGTLSEGFVKREFSEENREVYLAQSEGLAWDRAPEVTICNFVVTNRPPTSKGN